MNTPQRLTSGTLAALIAIAPLAVACVTTLKAGSNDAHKPMNTIREAIPEDFAAVRGLLTENGLVQEDLTPAHMAGFVVVPARGSSSILVAVAGVETFPDANEGLLRSVAVASALRGQGMGMGLVSAIEKRGATLGLRRLWLLTTTAPGFF